MYMYMYIYDSAYIYISWGNMGMFMCTKSCIYIQELRSGGAHTCKLLIYIMAVAGGK